MNSQLKLVKPSFFDIAIDYVLSKEEGFIEDVFNDGQSKNFGISLSFLKGLPLESLARYGFYGELSVDDVKNMTRAQACEVYRGEYWQYANFEAIFSDAIRNYVFDMCVQYGLSQGIKLLQQSIWAIHRRYNCILNNGVLNEATAAMINYHPSLSALICERAAYVRSLENQMPKSTFENWLNRCYTAIA